MHVFILEHRQHLSEQVLQEAVCGLEDGVDGTVVAIGQPGVVVAGGQQVVLSQAPGKRVTW